MSVGFRKTPSRLEVTDQSAAIAEATARGFVKTSPDMSAYREASQKELESTGELLPGVEVKPEGVSFSWRRLELRSSATIKMKGENEESK